jgi:hypothetical protein
MQAKSPPLPPTPLSPQTERLITQTFPKSEHEAIRSILLEYGTEAWHREIERLRFDVLHLAHGDQAKGRTLIDRTKGDHRDVLSAEYQWIDGKSVPRDWATIHPANQRT